MDINNLVLILESLSRETHYGSYEKQVLDEAVKKLRIQEMDDLDDPQVTFEEQKLVAKGDPITAIRSFRDRNKCSFRLASEIVLRFKQKGELHENSNLAIS